MKRFIILTVILVFVFTNFALASSFNTEEMPDRKFIFENNISIPGFAEAELKANELIQPLLIYNPQRNNCEMVYIICLENGEILWQSKPLIPGYGYKDIKLNKELPPGEYKATVAVRCYSLDNNKTELNSCKFACIFLVK